MEFSQAASTFAEIAHLLESEESRDARVHRVLELLDHLVPNECCAFAGAALEGRPSFHHSRSRRNGAGRCSIVALGHAARDEGNREIDPSGYRSGHLVLPGHGADRIIGVLQVERHDPYDVHHVQLLSAVASQLGVYLAMVELKDRERRAQDVLPKMSRAARDVPA